MHFSQINWICEKILELFPEVNFADVQAIFRRFFTAYNCIFKDFNAKLLTIWPHPTSTLIRVIFLFVHSFSTTFFYVTARGLMQNITHRISHSKTYHKYFTIETMQIKICKFLFTLVYTHQNRLWNFKCLDKIKLNGQF